DCRMWDEQFHSFAPRLQVIRYDMRYAGKSETVASGEPYTPYEDLFGVLQALNVAKATLVGLSGGARFAIDFAIAYPDFVNRLVLISPGMSGYQFVDEWTQQRNRALGEALAQGDLAAAVEVFVTMWTDGPYRTPEQVDPAVRERVRGMASKTIPHIRDAASFGELKPPAFGRLAEIRAPTLVVL